VDAAFIQGVRRYFDVECLKVTPHLDLGIRVAYGAPHEVGADRLVNAVAGVARYGAPLVIVDFGTAITVDVVSADGAYLGGAIAPGLVTSMEALFGRTAKLPKVGLEAPGTSIGRNTMESIRAGVIYGNAGLVDRLVEGIWQDLGTKSAVIATGGHAEVIAEHSRTLDKVDPWLTLDGLKMIYDRNRRERP
jgi:type III pantothenate kinase